jgi:hypothetical protein
VAQETGGRVLTGDPETAELFQRAGLTFPLEPLPTVKPLIILWLILFLLDVAMRRVAIDVRALARRTEGWAAGLFSQREAGVDESLEALKRRKALVREAMVSKEQKTVAGRRFEATPGSQASLPDQEFLKAPQVVKLKPAAGDAAGEQKEESSLDRLLAAKKRATKNK